MFSNNHFFFIGILPPTTSYFLVNGVEHSSLNQDFGVSSFLGIKIIYTFNKAFVQMKTKYGLKLFQLYM
ncbi:hypothetical protein PY97_10240 [Lacticaseibacillus rhamnosus]|nr:hypothetical protein PY97_10240 [Lacticaseibacillus rhamnosus]